MLVSVKDVSVVLCKHFRCERGRDHRTHFIGCGPEIAQVDRLAIDICPDGVLCQVDIYRACESVGDNQRWRCQEAGTHLGMDATFKVAIAAQDCCDDEIVSIYRLGNGIRQRTTVADAIVDCYCACYEGMEIVHRQVEPRPPACAPSFHYLERECR